MRNEEGEVLIWRWRERYAFSAAAIVSFVTVVVVASVHILLFSLVCIFALLQWCGCYCYSTTVVCIFFTLLMPYILSVLVLLTRGDSLTVIINKT